METWCQFIEVSGKDGYWFCPTCDPDIARPIHSLSAKINRKCHASAPSFKTYLKLGMTYAEAVARHILYGTTCTQEEIDKRYSICSLNLCGYFRQSYCGHPQCGCKINQEQKPLLNKLAMASEQCPDKPPRWKRINP